MPVFVGTQLSDSLFGTPFDDTISGLGGADFFLGAGGYDIVDGGSGKDTLIAGLSTGELSGGDGDDVIEVSLGGAFADGGTGRDYLSGGTLTDTLSGGSGKDTLLGNLGDDLLLGGSNGDLMEGGSGNDTLRGGEGYDEILGDDGDDSILGEAGRDTIFGGAGSDTIKGGTDRDQINGGEGQDRLEGDDGRDTIVGGEGDDLIDGGLDHDSLLGGIGDDTIDGSFGADVIEGDIGNDVLRGGHGHDTIEGDLGDDTIDGDDDDDVIEGGLGNDSILGGRGHDLISGGIGDDEIDAEEGADTVDGDDGADTIYGGRGDDLISGGFWHDSLDGGRDNDTISGGQGRDTLIGGMGGDSLDGGDDDDLLAGSEGDDTLLGGQGDDTLEGGDHADALDGGADDDLLEGNSGKDTLIGGDGDDTLEGGTEADELYGGADDDLLIAGAGLDRAYGGTGNDTLFGTSGINHLHGEAGHDKIYGGDGIDYIYAGSGHDHVEAGDGFDQVFYDLAENEAYDNVFDGGADFDLLVLRGRYVDFDNPAFQAELNAYQQHVTTNLSDPFSFSSFSLIVSNFELLALDVIDHAPTAVADTFDGEEDTQIAGDVLLNDKDEDGDSLTVNLVTGPQNGSVVLDANGRFVYTPDANFNGVDRFEYEAVDPTGAAATAQVTLKVAPVNDAPVAVDDVYVPGGSSVETFDVTEDVENTITPQSKVAQLTNGNLVLVWNELRDKTDFLWDVMARVYSPEGDTVLETFVVKGGFNRSGAWPDVTGTSDGGFAVVYSSRVETHLRRFDKEGTEVWPEHIVSNEPQDEIKQSPSVVELSDGAVLVTWLGLEGLIYDAVGRIYNADGSARTQTFGVNLQGLNEDGFLVRTGPAHIHAAEDGGFYAFWNEFTLESPGPWSHAIGFGRFDESGDLLAEEFFEASRFIQPQEIALLADGRVALLWKDLGTNADGQDVQVLRLAIMAADGTVDTEPYDIVVDAGPVFTGSTIVPDPDGGFAVAWMDYFGTEGALRLWVQEFDDDGQTIGAPQAIAMASSRGVRLSGVALDGGGYAFTWEDGVDVKLSILGQTDTVVHEDSLEVIPVHTLLVNDLDVDGDVLSVGSVSATSAEGAEVTLNGEEIAYDPTAAANLQALAVGETLTDTFTYTISDGNGGTDTATVTLTVEGRNDAPVAVDDTATTTDGQTVVINAVANDTDIDGDALQITAVTQGTHGNVTVVSGFLRYVPEAGFVGSDSFTYTVSDPYGATSIGRVDVLVELGNEDPVAGDDTATTRENTEILIPVLDNDSDPEGDALSISATTDPIFSDGEVEIVAGGILYTPGAGFVGTDAFSYQVSDGEGGFDTASVLVTVTANQPPVAVDDAYFGDEDTQITGNLFANDSDPEGDAFSLASHSVLAGLLVGANGDFTYTPGPDQNGAFSFTYQVVDTGGQLSNAATVALSVAAVNDAPVAVDDVYVLPEDTDLSGNVLANDTDADGDVLSVRLLTDVAHGDLQILPDGTFDYTADPDFAGSDGFTYEVSDGNGGTDTAQVTLTVTPVNDLPLAVDDQATTDEDQAVSIQVLSNDSDVEGPLSISGFGQGTFGAVQQVGDALFYTPDADAFGSDSFTYTVMDTDGASTMAIVRVEVLPVNDAPEAVADVISVNENASITFDALANDTDVEGDVLSVLDVTQGSRGTVDINPDGMLTYTPVADYYGSDSFTYTVTDSNGGTAVGDVSVTVTPQARAVYDLVDTLVEDGYALFDVTANDLGTDLQVVSFTDPVAGRLTQNADGSFIYVPAPDQTTKDQFTYQISDGSTQDSGVVDIVIKAINDAPRVVAPIAMLGQTRLPITFSAEQETAILPSDIEAGSRGSIRVTVLADAGQFDLGTKIVGVTILGEGTNILTLEGNASAVTETLDGMTLSSAGTLSSLTVLTEDLGNTGSGGNQAATQVIALTDGFITGTTGNDSKLNGGALTDFIRGLAGNDAIAGVGGMDFMLGEAGNDTIRTGDSDVPVALTAGVRDFADGGLGDDLIIVNGETTLGIVRGGAGDDIIEVRSAEFQGEIDGGEGDQDVLETSVNAVSLVGTEIYGIEETRLRTGLNIDATSADDLGTVRVTSSATLTLVGGGVATFEDMSIESSGAGFVGLSVIIEDAGTVVSLGDADNPSFGTVRRTVQGSDFDDIILGGGGGVFTVIDGGDGDDLITGGGAIESILGGAGMDTLSGGAGRDTLTGGADDDVLAGGADADLFVFSAGDGTDRITDFEDGVDLIRLIGLDFGSAAGEVSFRVAQGDPQSTELVINSLTRLPQEVLARIENVSLGVLDSDDILAPSYE